MTRWGRSEEAKCGLPQARIVALKEWGELLNGEPWDALSPEQDPGEAGTVPLHLGIDGLRGHEGLKDPTRPRLLVMDRG